MAEARRYPADGPCPCGSGAEYGDCCIEQGFEYLVDEDGEVFREVPIDEDLAGLLGAFVQEHVDRHGREPRPDDPLFPDAPPLEHLEADISGLLTRACVRPEMIHAFERTGYLVTEENRHLVPRAALEEWERAVREHRARHGAGEEE